MESDFFGPLCVIVRRVIIGSSPHLSYWKPGFVFLACLATRDNVGALKSVVLMVTLLIQLYIYAYAGDALECRTEEIAQAVYQSLWYRSRGRAARDLVLIINRGNLSCHLTAGRFLSMNIFTFKEILKTSVSYLSVLKVMMDTWKPRTSSTTLVQRRRCYSDEDMIA